MRKTDLVDAVAERMQSTKKDAAHAVEHVLGSIQDALSEGEDVNVIGFGKFLTAWHEKSTREMFGEVKVIPARNVVRFKPGKTLRDAVNA